MATTISVNKKTIKEFLENAQKQKFLIPEYQRPYDWEETHIYTLFDDLVNFNERKIQENTNETYFLGSIVQFINKNNEQEIIDGQQRITSLLLLLRVIYEKLQSGSEIKTKEENNFIKEIEPLIWEKNNFTGDADKDKLLINSKVILDEQNQVFHYILKTANADKNSKDRYSENFLKFKELYDEFCKNNPQKIYHFIYHLLNHTIILPIEADTMDTAFTIFTTLNDRGKPLNDADIFKAQIYGDLKDIKEKENFIEKWQDLENLAKKIDEKMQNLFYIYMFYLRAKDNDRDTTTPKLRTYLGANKFKVIKNPNLLEILEQILNLVKFSKDFEDIEDEKWSENLKIKQAFDLLRFTNNEWWKYPSVIYYLEHRNKENFEENYLKFLQKLFVEIWQRMSIDNTVNSLKLPILRLDIEILNDINPKFDFKEISSDEQNILNTKIKEPRINLRYAILKFLAYEKYEQNAIIPNLKLEIEHILPQKWKENYFTQSQIFTEAHLNEIKNNIGNLTLFEKKLNIKASNWNYNTKRLEYEKSQIKMTKALSQFSDWGRDNVIERNGVISDFIKSKFAEWLR